MYEVREMVKTDYVKIAEFKTIEEARHFRKMRMRETSNPTRVFFEGKEVI